MDIGQTWGYRVRTGADVVPVEVVRLGTRRPARVLVRFLDPDQEGREDWVPPTRLKVPWEQAEQFMARDRRWEQVRELSSPTHDETDEHAAGVVFDVVYRGQAVEVSHRTRDAGLATISDLPGVLGDIGWERAQVAEEPGVFFDDPDQLWVVPWPVTRAIAQALSEAHAEAVLRWVADEERKASYKNLHGEVLGRGAGAMEISPEICAEVDAEHGRPVREVLRRWCGQQACDRHDELQALRVEVYRLGRLVEAAISALETTGASRAAAQLRQDLGVHLPSA